MIFMYVQIYNTIINDIKWYRTYNQLFTWYLKVGRFVRWFVVCSKAWNTKGTYKKVTEKLVFVQNQEIHGNPLKKYPPQDIDRYIYIYTYIDYIYIFNIYSSRMCFGIKTRSLFSPSLARLQGHHRARIVDQTESFDGQTSSLDAAHQLSQPCAGIDGLAFFGGLELDPSWIVMNCVFFLGQMSRGMVFRPLLPSKKKQNARWKIWKCQIDTELPLTWHWETNSTDCYVSGFPGCGNAGGCRRIASLSQLRCW